VSYPLITPDVLPIARRTIQPELVDRDIDVPWFSDEVPERRPVDNRFIVVEQLNTRRPHHFATDVLTQFRVYDPDGRRCKTTAELLNGLIPLLPRGFEVQDTEHSGGPTELPDPDVPGVRRWLVTWWITVPTIPA